MVASGCWPGIAEIIPHHDDPGANGRDQRCVDDLARFPKLFCQLLRRHLIKKS